MIPQHHSAAATVADIVSHWAGAPPVTVVERSTDLPIAAPVDARGLYSKGAAWIVANTHAHHDVGATVAHEVLGHHGVRAALGDKWRPFMHAIQAGLRSGDNRLGYARSLVREAYVDDHGTFNLCAVAEADEIVALAAEVGFNPGAGRMHINQPGRKMAIAAAGQFARESLYLDRPASFTDVEGVLLNAEHRLRHGSSFWGLGYKLRRWYASAMSKPWDPNKPPMSLAQSEFLLREDADQRQAKSDRAGLYLVLQLLLAAVIFAGGMLAFFWNIGATVGFFR